VRQNDGLLWHSQGQTRYVYENIADGRDVKYLEKKSQNVLMFSAFESDWGGKKQVQASHFWMFWFNVLLLRPVLKKMENIAKTNNCSPFICIM